eukprot:864267-Amphidinium_carterae.1
MVAPKVANKWNAWEFGEVSHVNVMTYAMAVSPDTLLEVAKFPPLAVVDMFLRTRVFCRLTVETVTPLSPEVERTRITNLPNFCVGGDGDFFCDALVQRWFETDALFNEVLNPENKD